MSIETIKLSQKAKDQLVTLKRATDIEHWNVLCRWAFCLSLAEPTPPPPMIAPADSSVEMTWKTFAGPYQAIYLSLLKQRLKNDRIPTVELSLQFKLHLYRGLGYLVAKIKTKSIKSLICLLPPSTSESP